MANTELVSLFSYLLPNYNPIATKARTYKEADLHFFEQQEKQWQESGKIRSSNFPWRAHCLVVKNTDVFGEEKKKPLMRRLFTNRKFLYTNLDGYHLPRIDDMVNNLVKYSVLLTFDLKSAYHQIYIPTSNQPFTASQA